MENLLHVIRRRRDNGLVNHRLIRRLILMNIFENPAPQPERHHFDLDAIEDEYAELLFRFKKEDIRRLLRVLEIPENIGTKSGFRVTGLEGLCIFLRRLSYPNRLFDLHVFFGRSMTALSEICNFMSRHIIRVHGHVLQDLQHLEWLNREKLSHYAQAVAAKSAAVKNCWAFIDGTARPICRPTLEQEEYYSGHKRYHCVKYQSLLCPDGIIVNLSGAYPGRRHDAYIFGESGLYNQLELKTKFQDQKFSVYGDQAYGIRELLLCPYPGRQLTPAQEEFNRSMSIVRQAVEWGFQKIVSQFAFLDFKKNQKLLLQDIENMYKSAVILCNCHTCLYGSETAQFF